MITKWRLRNLKSVRSAEVGLKPLTVLSGVNSSGKSTLFQSMTLIAQTIANQLEKRALLLNGHMTTLGEFNTVCSLGETELLIGWDLAPKETSANGDQGLATLEPYATQETFRFQSVACEVAFADDPGRGPEVLHGSLVVTPTDEPAASCAWERRSSVEASAGSSTFAINFDAASGASARSKYYESVEEGCQLRHFLPVRLKLKLTPEVVNADVRAHLLCGTRRTYQPDKNPALKAAVSTTISSFLMARAEPPPQHELRTFSDWVTWLDPNRESASLKAGVDEVRSLLLGEERTRTSTTIPTHLPGVLPEAVFYTETFFATKFRYLGPLRDEPRSVYPHPNKLDPIDLGRRGELTAAAYHAFQDDPVRQIKISELEEFGPLASTRTTTLREAVDEWVRYLGVAHHVTSQEDKYGHVLLVGTAAEGGWEMAHVGTGVSQVLPVVVLGLLSQFDDTLVIEHPELHLHPHVQTRLADFFLFLALTGRQVLVETHSEYIINRLRYRMVAREGEKIREQVSILFADAKDGPTSFEEVKVTPYGAIENWPEGFFDEAAREAEMILAAAIERVERGSS